MHWYYSDKNEVFTVPLSQQSVSDLEVIDEGVLEKELTATLGKTLPKPSVQTVLVLDDEICFSTKITPPITAEMKTTLAADIPFAHVETVTVHYKSDDLAISTNSDFYQAIARCLSKIGYEAINVLPWVAVVSSGISEQGEMDRVTVKRIFDSLSSLRLSSFPIEKHHMTEPSIPLASSSPVKKKLPIGWVIFIGIALLYAGAMYWFFIRA